MKKREAHKIYPEISPLHDIARKEVKSFNEDSLKLVSKQLVLLAPRYQTCFLKENFLLLEIAIS